VVRQVGGGGGGGVGKGSSEPTGVREDSFIDSCQLIKVEEEKASSDVRTVGGVFVVGAKVKKKRRP